MIAGSNIDDVRAEIMRLESTQVFVQRDWAKVLIQLSDSPCRRADAVRRMETAKRNQSVSVAVETQDLTLRGRAWCGLKIPFGRFMKLESIGQYPSFDCCEYHATLVVEAQHAMEMDVRGRDVLRVRTDLGFPGHDIELTLVPVVMETPSHE